MENKAPQILRLSYEADLCHATLRNDTARRIQAFLGLAPPSRNMRLPLRQGRDDLSMRVSNWDEEFVVEPQLVRKQYLRRWFALDLFSSLPYQLAAIWIPNSTPFRVLSLPRLFRLTVLFRRFDVFTNADASRVVKFIIIFLFFAHAMGCVWWLTGYAAQFWRNSGAILAQLF